MRLRHRLTTSALWALCSVLGKTWRYTYSGDQGLNPLVGRAGGKIYCFWHSQILQFAYGFRNCDITTVVSSSRDGDLAVTIAAGWGHATIRGSSTRGGLSAVRECVRALRADATIVIIPDGPRGPREEVKEGVAQVSLISGAPVVPVKAAAQRQWRLNSWDRFVIPRPFSRIHVTFGDALKPEEFASCDDRIALFTSRIQKALAQ